MIGASEGGGPVPPVGAAAVSRVARAGGHLSDRLPCSVRVAAGALAAVPVTALTALRVAVNAPVSLPRGVADAAPLVVVAALVATSLAALVVAVTTDEALESVGLAFAGTFGLLAALSPAAALPATAAVAGGGMLAVVARLGVPRDAVTALHALVAAVLLVAVGAGLASSMGVATVRLRPLASTLALVGIAASPAFVRPTRGDLAVGVAAVVVVLQAGRAAPFVAGAVALVGGAVVGASLLLIALAVGGTVTTAVAGVRRRPTAALGATLLLAAGVPVTVPRALATVLGCSLLVGGEST